MKQSAVLVTGGAGYIGSHVCKVLAMNGFTPIAYDNLCSGNAQAVKWGPFEQGDIRDRERLSQVIETYQPVAIMHFAALIQVGDSVNDPSSYYENNIFGSWCLLEEARRHNIRNMVFSSTAAVYGQPQTDKIAEDHSLNPINPYGQTKLTMENMIRDFAGAYDLNYAILRYFNAAGADPDIHIGSAYRKDTHIIPLLMQTASGQREHIDLYGMDYNTPDGTAIRDYIHVTDLADAHCRALNYLIETNDNLTLNLGTSTGHSVRSVMTCAQRVTQRLFQVRECERRAGDPDVLVANAEQAKTVLDWQPVYSNLETIMDTAWKWKLKQVQHGPTEAFTARETTPQTDRVAA